MSRNGKLILGYMPMGTGEVFPFNAVFDYGQNIMQKGFDDVDAIVLWGGTDIHPSYYKEVAHPRNEKYNQPVSVRDENEWKAMKYAYANNIPIIGVCRGAQFLCAFSGGRLIQHTTGHHGPHNVMFSDRTGIMQTSSCHHQMMFPWVKGVDYQLLAWSSSNLSSCYQDQYGAEIPEMAGRWEPEVVYFPKTRGLAIQGHPEWMEQIDPFVQYCNEKVETLLINTKEEAEA